MRTFLIALLTTTCPLMACGQPPETVAQHTYPCGVSISEGMVEAFLSEPDLWDPGERLSDFGISREEMATRAGAVLLALTEEAEAEGLIDDPSLLNRLDHLRWELRREMLYSALQASCEVTEEEIQALYEEERDRLHQPEERRLWSILIEAGLNPTEADWEAARSRGMEALRRLRGGESFGAVAHDLGEGPSAENGGDFGPVGPSNLPESTRDLIWALPEGEISDLVRLAMGYAIFRTTDWRDEGPTPLQRVRHILRERLLREKVSSLRRHLYARWVESVGGIEDHRENYREVEHPLASSTPLVTIGDQVFTEEDYRRWIDGSRIYPASREAEHMHGLFAQSALDNAFVDAQPLPDEDLFANRWAATRAHLIASSLVRQAIRRHPPTEEELGAILEARWRDHPQLILREISVIRLSTAPAWGEEEIPAHYLLQRAQASAEMIATRFADGEDFAQLAREFSDAPSAEEGGHLGWVGEPSAPDIDTPLRGTGEGQVTAPHRTPTALLIYHVNAVRPKPFGEARRALESIWFGEREQEIGLALFHALDDEGPVDWTQRLERAAAEDFLPTGD